jgi:hypothetical protein
VKRVRVTLKPGSLGKKIFLFPTAEALYLWLCTLDRGEMIQIPDIEELVLEPDGFIEAELMGFEYAYEGDNEFRRLDLIRLGKSQQPKNASGTMVTVHSGWVSGGLLPLRHYSDMDIDVRTVPVGEEKLDLPVLFNDDDGTVDVSVDEEEEDEDK